MEVQGFPNYLIYEDGRVFNKQTNYFKKATKFKQTGYMFVSLYNNTKDKKYLIHRLIAIHYIPNPMNKPQVDHKDRNRLNNDISNLRWVDACENQENIGPQSNNTSGHKGISKHSQNPNSIGWVFEKGYRGKRYRRRFKSKTDALCYKFYILLKINLTESNLIRI